MKVYKVRYEYLELSNETKEKFKDNLRSINKLTVQDALLIDKIFDEFIENL